MHQQIVVVLFHQGYYINDYHDNSVITRKMGVKYHKQ